jgi:hypothetical protein
MLSITFHVCFVPLTPFFPQGVNFVHRGFNVPGGYKERRGCAVFITYTAVQGDTDFDLRVCPVGVFVVTVSSGKPTRHR